MRTLTVAVCLVAAGLSPGWGEEPKTPEPYWGDGPGPLVLLVVKSVQDELKLADQQLEAVKELRKQGVQFSGVRQGRIAKRRCRRFGRKH